MELVLRNILLGISLAAPIGPSGVAIIQNGLRAGFFYAFLTGVGVTLADATYLLVVFFGLSSFLDIPAVKISIWFLGAAALLYFGVRTLREAGRALNLEAAPVATARSPLLTGYIVNASNPIAVVWWLGVFGSLLSEAEPGASRLSALALSATILAGILMFHTSVSLLSHWGRHFLNVRLMRAVSVLAGIALLGFGLRFAVVGILTIVG
jgi:threonine/homoserine/homoserine lactone efflux protein